MIKPVKTNNQISFKYKWRVKKMFNDGQLPEVKVDIYGKPLKVGDGTVEHIIAHSKGGKSIESNYALAGKAVNNARSNRPIQEFTTFENMKMYYEQFIGIVKQTADGCKFIGDEYFKNGMKLAERIFKK